MTGQSDVTREPSGPGYAALAAPVARVVGPLPDLFAGSGPLAVLVARIARRRVARAWAIGRPGMANLSAALEGLAAQGAAQAVLPDCIEVNLGFNLRRIAPERLARDLSAMHSGVGGLALLRGDSVVAAVGATETIAANLQLLPALEVLLAETGFGRDALARREVEVGLFDCAQLLIEPAAPERCRPLVRGGRSLLPEAVTREAVERWAERMAGWMRRNTAADGRIVYKYWPSAGRESDGDNSVRQTMATLCLGLLAARTGTAEDRALADRNLDHLLRRYYAEEGPLGLIVEGEKVKLGACAIAALAVAEHPDAGRYAAPLAKLRATVASLWREDGSFRSFHRPAERNDNQNFYPGEALLFWARRLAAGDPAIDAERYLRSFRFYREHFRRAPNPAFVPWHTQAHCASLPVLGERELAAFVFEMNDWLLAMQQWQSAPYPDMRGRFYDPRHDYGPPHASSTAVYLEGLIDAFALARSEGDGGRADAYRTAILRGLRSLMQLQFRSADEMYYVADRARVAGGIRTEVYDNTIRVDNVQHALMGAMKILDRFAADDYRLPA